MSQAAQLIFTPKRGRLQDLAVELPFWVGDLDHDGYMLESEWAVTPLPEHDEVRLTIHWVTKPAARLAMDREKNVWWEAVMKHAVEEPRIEWLPGSQQVPTCRCPKRAKPALKLWCTPRSKCPPLLCEEGGTMAFYSLGINTDILRRLHSWNRFARAVAEVSLAHAVDVENPYAAWANHEARDPTSALNKMALGLAKEIKEDIGRKVIYRAPPFHLYWL